MWEPPFLKFSLSPAWILSPFIDQLVWLWSRFIVQLGDLAFKLTAFHSLDQLVQYLTNIFNHFWVVPYSLDIYFLNIWFCFSGHRSSYLYFILSFQSLLWILWSGGTCGILPLLTNSSLSMEWLLLPWSGAHLCLVNTYRRWLCLTWEPDISHFCHKPSELWPNLACYCIILILSCLPLLPFCSLWPDHLKKKEKKKLILKVSDELSVPSCNCI